MQPPTFDWLALETEEGSAVQNSQRDPEKILRDLLQIIDPEGLTLLPFVPQSRLSNSVAEKSQPASQREDQSWRWIFKQRKEFFSVEVPPPEEEFLDDDSPGGLFPQRRDPSTIIPERRPQPYHPFGDEYLDPLPDS